MMSDMNVLFICAQNVGRSQMAAELFNKLSTKGHADSVGTTVESPGQTLGERAVHSDGAKHVLTVLDEEEINVRNNKRTLLTEDMLSTYDYVGVMAERDTWPAYLAEGTKVVYWDIADPRFKGLETTRKTRDEIKQRVAAFIQQHDLS